ncbi:hypothetical protein Poli38472_010409 [Pythium oligandrum]|uniref:SAM-dependent MTase RsmB/NOP-type domain-containing protein n=1 Tax=Pythium oligandrum TaxID=41045 RepID=A0A8K1C3M4_PYTOL|nr:hypothetical protein Poli38472_010409 [Pythium oligandrum]|eukprot:TMW55527.1 hypothetical protein Poli38472_010409 [Pythium oligandrum]
MAGEPNGETERVLWHDAAVWERSGFNAFLAEHGIKRSDLVVVKKDDEEHTEQRFFRVKQTAGESSQLSTEEVITRVGRSLQEHGIEHVQPEAVDWVPGFFSLPASTPLARIDMYQQGQLYGIDISSGYAVTLLDVKPGEHVLDLCCAPGAKLTMIADLLQMRGSVTGVDFSRSRIGACKQLVHKYKLIHPESAQEESTSSTGSWRCRLFHADGRTFAIGPKTECAQLDDMEIVLDTEEISSRNPKSQGRKRKNKSARARDLKRQKLMVVNEALYDKVLVDAECTHDGSVKHLQKLETAEAWDSYVKDHLNDSEITRILNLQHDLIRNGYALLRPGGTMIYSTCSLSIKQNEDIVRAFLKATPSASLLPVDTTDIPCEAGKLEGTVRFTPAHHTSGLFIAKIRKLDSVTSVTSNSGSE